MPKKLNIWDAVFATPEENVACDEALLDWSEETGGAALRFWEARHPFVVLGYSNGAEIEADTAACRKERIPIVRRCSGGGTVLQAPGCLSYALVFPIEGVGHSSVTRTNVSVMERNRGAMAKMLGEAVTVEGHTDLALGGLKFSGNSQRRKRKSILFHGTFLVDLDFTLVSKALKIPSLEPSYRAGRPHEKFLMNLPASAARIREALAAEWNAAAPFTAEEDILGRLETLLPRYRDASWTYRF